MTDTTNNTVETTVETTAAAPKKKEPKVNLIDNAHVDFTITRFRVNMAYDEQKKIDVLFINEKQLPKISYTEIKKVTKDEEAARRISLYLVNEYIIRGVTRSDVLEGTAK